MRRIIRLLTLVLIAASSCIGCQRSPRFYSYQPVDPRGWHCTDTLHFSLPADSTTSLRTFSLGARFTERVRYRGLWLVLEQRASSFRRRDTLYLPLANENGQWAANGVVYHEAEAVCTAALTEGGQPLQLLVYHLMPEQEIEGFTEVGVKVE